jgi:hypothetical protein
VPPTTVKSKEFSIREVFSGLERWA